ncbi:MAG: PHP domain-containing protein [Solirubrobacteraceae bacterium]
MPRPPAPTFDLQSHSAHSDGELAADELVAAAAAAGVELLALTDHDTIAGVGDAEAAARSAGIRLVPATEITAIFEGGRDLHILGYLLDPSDEVLRRALERSRGSRELRAEAMVRTLRELGFAVDDSLPAKRAAEGGSVGRPHIAQAVVGSPANRSRLQDEGLTDPNAFLAAYLTEGRPAFVPRAAPTVAEAITLIHGAGGLAVWAHPFWDIEQPDGVLAAVDAFHALGLDGVEAFYATHTEAQTRLLARRCTELELLSTGSSDFHGPHHRLFSSFRAFDTFGLEPRLGPLAG